MVYGLTRLVLASTSFLPITEDHYLAIENAKLVLREGLYIEQMFDFLIANYIDFENALLKAAVQDMVCRGQDYNWFATNRANLDRRIMNLLTVARTYIDTMPQHVNRLFGRDAQKTAALTAYFAAEYDGRIGYRAMYELRNFIQHQGFPVHSLNCGSSWVGAGDDRKLRYTVDPYISPVDLRESDFKRAVLAELEAEGADNNLKSLLRDHIEGLSSVHSHLRDMIGEQLVRAEGILDDSILLFQQAFPDENSMIALAAVRCESEGIYKDKIAITLESNAYRLHLQKKNQQHVNLTKRYVSSEVVSR